MLIFETKIKFLQYFLSSLGCFYIIPISFFCFYANKNNDLGLFFLGTVFIILGIVQFSFTLKSFQIHSDCLIVKRPMFIFNPNRTFQKNEILKIIFKQSKSRIGGGNYLVVNTKYSEESFMLTFSSKTLKELIAKLKEVEIKTVVEFKIE
jgi:Na+/melibiose symporter-like transporter